jgi:tetratricopeptide (TPR) repeat protein
METPSKRLRRSPFPGWLLALALAQLAAQTARAGEPDPAALRTDAARKHYLAGKSAYEGARYDEALREFIEGYRLSPRPEFLLNIAQSCNKLGRRAEAMANYESFLAADPESPFAETARANLAALKRERAAAPPATAAPVAPPVENRPAAQPAPRSKVWHLAWAIPVGAVVIGAVAVGVYFGTRPSASCDPKNCVDLSRGH